MNIRDEGHRPRALAHVFKFDKAVSRHQAELLRRINQELIKQGQVLKNSRSFPNLGNYCIIDIRSAIVIRSHVNLTDLANELGM
jgi:uncharacterized protein YaaR (DUF327 family)